MLFERVLLSGFIILLTLQVFASSPRRFRIHNQQVSQHLLTQSLLLYNSELRNPNSGQYYDAISLSPNANAETNSSVAATGMGLISLALADAMRIEPDADIKAIQTMAAILNPDFSKRHPSFGWFRHWFNAADGADNSWSKADGYSTIDTAILAAGSVIAANYFASQGQDLLGIMRQLSDQILTTVDWSSAIADMNAGRLYLNYDLQTGSAKAVTSKFNEYVLVSCMGKLSEERQGLNGPMTQFWNQHFASTANLPKRTYSANGQNIQLLTDHPLHFLSSFTIQFAYYLCADVNNSVEYVNYFKNAQKADQLWFLNQSVRRDHYWGHGAGEALNSTYAANALGNNRDLIVSPHIVSGFLAEAPENIADLVAMYEDKKCVYTKNTYEFLWRCSLLYPEQRLNRLQAIDFSTMFLGLATIQPEIGREFFKNSGRVSIK